MFDYNKDEVLDFAKKYEICNSHTHIFPEKIAQKAVKSIGDFYGLDMDCQMGTADELVKDGELIGVTHYIVCSTATTAAQVESINSFIIEECRKHPEFIGFGTLHPDFENIEDEVERCISNGLRGIKLHPDFQHFKIDDDKAMKIYEAIKGRLPVLVHMGDNRYDYSQPARLANVVKRFPELVVFAAHLGGYSQWDDAAVYLQHFKNVYFDTCSSLEFISPEFAKELIRAFGIEKIFFGTDYPMWDHMGELSRFIKLNLTEEENKLILSENFKKFFGI